MQRTRTMLAALICALTVALAAGCGEKKAGTSEPSEARAKSSSVTSSTGNPENSTSDSNGDPLSPLWEKALYKEDCEIGAGAHNARITVGIGERKVTITVKSDKNNLAEMLTESGLAEGEESSYGLYIKRVNGVLADYDADKAFWSLMQNGTPTAVGASSITVADGDSYELVYTLADDMDAAA